MNGLYDMAKIKINLDNMKRFVPAVNRRFAKIAPKPIKRQILDDLNSGVSPVRGEGKLEKYSDFYKDAIRGEAHTDDSGQSFIWRSDKGGRPYKVYVPEGFNNTDVTSQGSKSISPVNLKLSGKLHKSLNVAATSFPISGRPFLILRIQFKHFLAYIHNNLGAGKKGVVRRMLPTEAGERFNNKTTRLIKNILNASVSFVVKKNK